ncbi:hypothetical protein [Mycoplasma bradburyae]|uniref:hypothetical protein n=1 Tax=Mycoplasma bradburyae TaxID=2963128 RepID=UPI00233FFBF8|nr:hypothetical protein [Mycoplasma bradburyae]MDC4182621.1 hypothetical protein [Mycoplasma bradburyae]
MNNLYKTNFDLAIDDKKLFRYNIIKIENNETIGMCYVTNYKQMFELAINCSYEIDNINAYVDRFYIILKEESLYDDVSFITNIWKQKKPLIDNIGFIVNDKVVYQANKNQSAWYEAFVKKHVISLLTKDSTSSKKQDYQKNYQDDFVGSNNYVNNISKEEYPSIDQRFSSLGEMNRYQSKYDFDNDEFATKYSPEYKQDRYSYQNNKYDNQFLGYSSPWNSYDGNESYNKAFDNSDFSINSNNNLGSSSSLHSEIDSLRRRMFDIDQQINNYETITKELSDIANNDSLDFDYQPRNNTTSYDSMINSPTIGIEDFKLNNTTTIDNTSNIVNDLNTFDFSDSTKSFLINHSDDFND